MMKPKPSSLGQQIKQAQKEWEKLPQPTRDGVKLQGSSEPKRIGQV